MYERNEMSHLCNELFSECSFIVFLQKASAVNVHIFLFMYTATPQQEDCDTRSIFNLSKY